MSAYFARNAVIRQEGADQDLHLSPRSSEAREGTSFLRTLWHHAFLVRFFAACTAQGHLRRLGLPPTKNSLR